MKIGLVRHFKVKKDNPGMALLSQKEVMQWFAEYDEADVKTGEVDLGGISWTRCYASDLPRAVKTAETIYDGENIRTAALREIPIYPVFRGEAKMPFWCWAFILRVAWLLNHPSQLEGKKAVQARISTLLDDILLKGGEDVLIVGHAAFMLFMRKELVNRGFRGPALRTIANGRLYVFEKAEGSEIGL
ncbi:histidine phosphatase family protein [Brevibacillus borstelensis]|uniref:histidine phosphatase family protein n=1 Tax=Brevibacillus borstelensis TaxID=45462 RepID=UPI000F075002|nr:histidine phosphatase family protein [Brevibacillus borstelensis]MED1884053.1 histidine phosphatase family protein [Brevibacillus borstelensis]RNB63474.1 histidine phosphatase family protein [Brevibacillus borstelensis]GED51060.1 hypothetical protein BBO01nite_03010 [Brevibacillus borstelensis]